MLIRRPTEYRTSRVRRERSGEMWTKTPEGVLCATSTSGAVRRSDEVEDLMRRSNSCHPLLVEMGLAAVQWSHRSGTQWHPSTPAGSPKQPCQSPGNFSGVSARDGTSPAHPRSAPTAWEPGSGMGRTWITTHDDSSIEGLARATTPIAPRTRSTHLLPWQCTVHLLNRPR